MWDLTPSNCRCPASAHSSHQRSNNNDDSKDEDDKSKKVKDFLIKDTKSITTTGRINYVSGTPLTFV